MINDGYQEELGYAKQVRCLIVHSWPSSRTVRKIISK